MTDAGLLWLRNTFRKTLPFFQESFEKIKSSINWKRIDFQLEDSKNNGTSHKFNWKYKVCLCLVFCPTPSPYFFIDWHFLHFLNFHYEYFTSLSLSLSYKHCEFLTFLSYFFEYLSDIWTYNVCSDAQLLIWSVSHRVMLTYVVNRTSDDYWL